MKNNIFLICIITLFFTLFGCSDSSYSGDGDIEYIKTGMLGSDGIYLNFPEVDFVGETTKVYDFTGLDRGRVPYTFYYISKMERHSILNCKISFEYYVNERLVTSASSLIKEMRASGPVPHREYYFEDASGIAVPDSDSKLRLVFQGKCSDKDRNVKGFVRLRSGGGEK